MSEEKQPRAVAPRFPFISLQRALERCVEFRAAAGDHAILATDARRAWGYGEKSSGGDQTIGALGYYGLLEREGTGRLRLTDLAKRYLRDERPEIRADLIRRFALEPKAMRDLWNQWKNDPPPGPAARSILRVDFNFPDKAADEVLRIYRDNLAFAQVPSSVILPADSGDSESHNGAEEKNDPPLAKVKVGDYVLWAKAPFDQRDTPQKIVWLSEDGSYVRVHDSMTGIPMPELTVVAPPAPASHVPPIQTPASPTVRKDAARDINVLLTSAGRLQITAEVDAEGLKTLQDMLEKYKQILALLETPLSQIKNPSE